MVAALIAWPPGSLAGLPSILPASLPKATTEPVKVTAPMKMPRKTSTFRIRISTGILWASTAAKPASASRLPPCSFTATTEPSSNWALRPIKTAARPTKEWSAATSCGISVISTFLAT